MASDQIIAINQLASRLENATNTERIDALQDLQSHAKVIPEIVGSLSLKKVLDFLQEQGSAEEYQEALDLIYRLVKCRDKNASKSNANIILGDVNAVELLLDLLNHEDLTVGVMTSQILTEIHACNGPSLELQIQQCPDGMNKLLQRLPDSSREEVRNQAIVLIQELTSTNEEMKKTVVFNEGFEILFGIIHREGGFEDAGLVVQDCLFICNNILSDSETCQRLFFAMGSDWILRLADFFDPSMLESLEKNDFSLGVEDDDDDGPGPGQSEGWFDDPARLACAVLALASLYRSLSVPNKKHQNTLATSTSVVIPSAAFWVARRGPSELVNAGLSLLSRLVEGGNVEVANLLSNSYIKVSPAVARKNFPADVEIPQLVFGWKPLPGDDRKFISILSLLAERYIYPAEAWNPREGAVLGAKLKVQYQVLTEGEANLAQSSLLVLEQILASDTSIGDLIVQYILAPPPPPHLDGVSQDDDGFNPEAQQLESMRPLGLQILSLLVEGCNKILEGSGKSGFDVAERAANVLSVIFIHGSQLAKELCTRVTTTHIGNGMGKNLVMSSHAGGHKFILPLLLFTAGRIARSAGGAGYPLLISFLRMLACIVSDCESAAKQVLEDPAILIVVMDLATTTSESAGVPPLVQVAASLFLGCCFEALPAPTSNSPPPSNGGSAVNTNTDDTTLNRKSFLSMIDGRIGLSRFTDLLKKPLAPRTAHNKALLDTFTVLFVTPDFQAFFTKQVEAIRAGIFGFYTAGSEAAPGDAMQQQVIEMQKEKIAELEQRLAMHTSGAPVVDNSVELAAALEASVNDRAALAAALEASAQDQAALAEAREASVRDQEALLSAGELESRLREDIRTLESSLEAEGAEVKVAREATEHLDAQLRHHMLELEAVQAKWHHAEATAAEAQRRLAEALEGALSADSTLQTQLAEAKAVIGAHADEVLALKQSIVTGHQENKQLKETLDQRDRKIELLMGELKGAQPADNQAERKISDLELRNADLKAQLWAVESELKAAQEHKGLSVEVPTTHDTMSDVSLVTSPPPVERSDPSFSVVAEAAISLVRLLGIGDELSDFQLTEDTLRGADADSAERHRLVEELLSQCRESISTAVNECSDIAEQAGIHDLEGDEGSVLRFLDCCHKLRENILDASQHTQEASEAEQLKLQIDFLEQQLTDAEGAISDLSEQVRVLEDALEGSVNEVTRLQELQEAAQSSNAEAAQLRDELSVERANFEALVQALREQIATLELQLLDANEAIAKAEAARQQQISDAAQSGDTVAARLREELTVASDQLVVAKAEVVALEGQLRAANGEVARITEESAAEAARLRDELAETKAEATMLHTQWVGTNAEMELNTEANNSVVASLRAELSSAAMCAEVNTQVLKEQIAALEAELITTKESLASASTTIDTLRAEADHLQELQDSTQAGSSEVDALCQELSTRAKQSDEQATLLREEIEILKAGWREADEAAATSAATIETLRAEVAQTKEQANSIAQHTANLDATAKAAEHRATTAEQTVEDLTVELEGVRKASNQSTEEIRTELERVRHELIQKEHQAAEALEQLELHTAASAGELAELKSSLEAQFEEQAVKRAGEAEQKIFAVKESLEQQLVDAWGEMDLLRTDLLKKIAEAETAAAADKEQWETDRAALQHQVSNAYIHLADLEKNGQHGASALDALRTASEQVIATLQAELNAKQFASGAVVVENGALRAQLNAAEDIIAQLEDGYSAVGTRCAAAEAENAQLAQERHTFSQSVEEVQAQLDALHMQYDSETSLLKEAIDKQSRLARQYEQELERVRQETEEELSSQDKKYADLLLNLEELDAKTAAQHSMIAVLQGEISDRTDQENLLRVELDSIRVELEAERATVAQLRETYEASASSLDALQSQAQELRRLSQSVDHLSRETNAKEQQIQSLTAQLRRREGEAAGVLTTFESVKADIALLREENERLSDKYIAENKLVQERDRRLRALQTALENEQNELVALRTRVQTEKAAPREDLSALVHSSGESLKKLEGALKEVVAWVISTYKITDYKVTTLIQADGTRLLTVSTAISVNIVSDAFKLLDVLRSCVTWLVEHRDTEIRDKIRALGDKDQELASLRRILIAFESSDHQHAENVLHTPVRGHAGHHAHNGQGATVQHVASSLSAGTLVSTPEGKGPAHSAYSSNVAVTPSNSGTGGNNAARWSGAKSAILQASPAAKQAAKLHSEVLKERNKLASLQEQHSDLLGLLAQQDVELSVFRELIQSRLGSSELKSVEDVARTNTIDLYGSYTQFRYDL